MYAIQLVEHSLNAFRRATLPDPQPGPEEVLIHLRAAALNYIDVAVATGRFPGAPLPMVPVTEQTAWRPRAAPDARSAAGRACSVHGFDPRRGLNI